VKITQALAAPILWPHQSRLYEIVVAAWNDYMTSITEQIRCLQHRRTRACIVHDFMVSHAKRLFEGVPGVHIEDRSGIVLLVIDDRLAIRFKKLDKENRTRNYPTQQALAFMQQLDLPTIPSLARLVVGYRLTNLETELESVFVVCPNGLSNAWGMELKPPAIGGNVVPLTPRPTGPAPVVRPRLPQQILTEMAENDERH
jgi:hypothetical protein